MIDRSDPIYPEFRRATPANLGSQEFERHAPLPDLTISPKEIGPPLPATSHEHNQAVEEPAVTSPDAIAPERTQARSSLPETAVEIGKTVGHATVDVPEPAVAPLNPTPRAAAQDPSDSHSSRGAFDKFRNLLPRKQEPPAPTSSETPEIVHGVPIQPSDVPRLSLGGNTEKALDRDPDEIAIHEERRAEVVATTRDIALPYQRALRDIVPDEPQKGWFGVTRGGSVEKEYGKVRNGKVVTYKVLAEYVPYGGTNDLTRANIKISTPDVHKKEIPSVSLEFGPTGLETATLDVPYRDVLVSNKAPLRLIQNLTNEQASGPVEAFIEKGRLLHGFTLKLSTQGDLLACQFRSIHIARGESSQTVYKHTSLLYNPATDRFELYDDGWNKRDFQPLNNKLIDGRTQTDSRQQPASITREQFFSQLRAVLNLLPTQESKF